MGAEALFAFALTSVLIELTPGPNMAYLAVLAATEGRRPGFAAVAGVALGLAVVGLAAALGLSALIAAEPLLYQALRWAGVLYLMWLAYEGWRGADEDIELAGPGSSIALFFRRGFITNVLNPKAAVFYVTVLPTFLPPDGAFAALSVTLSAIYVAVATLIHTVIVGLAGAARPLLEDPWRSRILRRVLALALAGVAVWLAWKTRT